MKKKQNKNKVLENETPCVTHGSCTAEFRGELPSLFVTGEVFTVNLFYVLCCVVKLQVSVNFLPETFLVIEPQPELDLKMFLNFGKLSLVLIKF